MNNNLNVCLLNDSFPPLIDGVANTVQNYADILTNHGDNAIVTVPSFPNAVDDYNYKVVRYKSLPTTKLVGYRTGYPFSASKLAELEGYKFDIIHSHCPFVSTVIARTVRERINVPLVFTYHTKFDIDIKRIIKSDKLAEKTVKALVKNISSCDEVWAVSKGAADNLRELGYSGEIVVMKNGVDLPNGKVTQDRIDNLALRYDINTNNPIFLFVGRLRWYKGIKIILDGISKLKQDGKDFTMIFVGKGEDLEEMKQYAIDNGVIENCLFAGPVYDREELRDYYSLADLFIFPSSYDTFGLVVREAAACETASVLIKGSCAAEDAIDDVDAFLIDETGEALYNKLNQVGFDKNITDKVGKQANKNLYISWSDSVALAKERYKVVIDRYKQGSTNRKYEFSDEFLGVMDEICDKVTWIRNQRDKIKGIVTGDK